MFMVTAKSTNFYSRTQKYTRRWKEKSVAETINQDCVRFVCCVCFDDERNLNRNPMVNHFVIIFVIDVCDFWFLYNALSVSFASTILPMVFFKLPL